MSSTKENKEETVDKMFVTFSRQLGTRTKTERNQSLLANAVFSNSRGKINTKRALSFDAFFSSFSLAKSLPRDLQITAYKWSAYV